MIGNVQSGTGDSGDDRRAINDSSFGVVLDAGQKRNRAGWPGFGASVGMRLHPQAARWLRDFRPVQAGLGLPTPAKVKRSEETDDIGKARDGPFQIVIHGFE